MKKALKRCGTSLSKSTYVLWEYQKDRKEAEKVSEEIMAEHKFPDFDEKHYIHIQKAQQNSSRENAEIHIQTHHTAKSQTPKENLESRKRKTISDTRNIKKMSC